MVALRQAAALEGWTIQKERKEGMQVGEYGVKKYGDKKIVCRKTRNYHEV